MIISRIKETIHMKVFFYSYKTFESSYLSQANTQRFESGYTSEALSLKTAQKSKGYDVVSVFTADDVSAPVIEILKNNGIRFIAVRAAGYDNVDIVKAEDLGIKVANVPAYSPNSVAEHAIGMMLALNRKLLVANRQVHDQNFTLDNLVGFDLNKKTVGIVGTGKIGSVAARILYGFGCRLIAHDINPDKELAAKYDIKYVTMKALCANADIITLHIPLNDGTRHLIDHRLLHRMKRGVMLINTSRGALINTSELISAIEAGHVGYAGLDVYEKEQGLFFFDHSFTKITDDLFKKLQDLPNVLVTPHQAFATKEALTNIASTTYQNIECWANKINSPNELGKRKISLEDFEEEEA